MRPCCAARSSGCCPATTSTSPTGATRSWCRSSDGRFDLDDYIDYLIEFLEHIGPGAHMLAVCQPSVPAYAAACLMSADRHPCRPRTLTLMGGPIDTREAPTAVNTLATQRPYAWFERNVIATVPYLYPGAGRSVYPGFLQLAGFMTMNLGNHLVSHWEMFKHLVQGDGESADATKDFLRRISLGLRHDRRILPADRRRRLPAPRCCPRASSPIAAAASIRRRSATSRCWRSRASATISAASARPRRRSPSPRRCRRR